MDESVPIRWSAYEHENVERGRDWYYALGIAAVALAAIAVLFNNMFFGILILVAAFTLALLARHPATLVDFEISDRGIKVAHTLHHYEEIIGFWVEDSGEGTPLLLVDTTKFLSPNLIIPIAHVDPSAVRAFLMERAIETPMREPLAHKILEIFGL